jgi:hypothetical protein
MLYIPEGFYFIPSCIKDALGGVTMDAKLQYTKEEFIGMVTNKVYDLHKNVINTSSQTRTFIGDIKFCMNCLWREETVDYGWAGSHVQWTKKEIDVDRTLKFIQGEILPHLESAETAALPAGINAVSSGILTELVRSVKSWFRVPNDGHSQRSADDVGDLNARVDTLENTARKTKLLLDALAKLLQNG